MLTKPNSESQQDIFSDYVNKGGMLFTESSDKLNRINLKNLIKLVRKGNFRTEITYIPVENLNAEIMLVYNLCSN